MLIYGSASETPLRLGIVNHDTGKLAQELLSVIETSGSNMIINEIQESEINNFLLDKDLEAVVVIPAGYTNSIYNGDLKLMV